MTIKPLMKSFVRSDEYLGHSHHAESSITPDSHSISEDPRNGWRIFGRGPVASVLCGLTLVFGTAAQAQETATTETVAETATEDEEEIIYLSPFVIDAATDVGYRSTNSTSGTSLNTPIKELPMTIEVINRDFLDDTGAINFREALQYSAGVVLNEFTSSTADSLYGNNGPGANEQGSAEVSPSSRGGLGQRFSNSMNIRGFNVPFQNRDGFRYGGQIASYGVVLGGLVDASNLSRLEVVRGPNSLLYGIGVLSGIVNMIPKRPLPESAGSASVSVGNYDYRRATFDWTAPLKKDLWGGYLSYRVGAALTHSGHWTDYLESDSQYYVGQLEFKNDKWNVFFETQYSNQKQSGIGDQFVYDNLPASIDPDFRNGYYEQFNWQKDYLGMPQSTRITGPDTYAEQKELDLLFNVDFTPIENLTISAGAFLTDIDSEEFNVNIATLNNEEGPVELKGVLYQRLVAAERAAEKDPADRTPSEAEQAEQAPFLRNWFDTYVYILDSPLQEDQAPNDPRQLTDYRFTRYWWKKAPMESSTEQFRLRGTYTFETKDFVQDARAKHTFLAGFSYIKDEADFTTGDDRIGRNYAVKRELADDDPLLERNIFDPNPIRYNGEPLAMPGFEMRHADVWYRSLYGLYQGRLLDERLGIIAGLRWDEYHSRDRLYNRFNQYESIGDDYAYGPDYDGPLAVSAPSTVWWSNPESETFGWVPPLEGQSEYAPGDEPEAATSATLALNYKITPALTIYGLSSEGLTPNIGLRDGNNDPLASEQSKSLELGVKFDLFEGKLSGTISAYRIRRENAVWYVNNAVAPSTWYGALNPPSGYSASESGNFRPDLVENGQYVINYGLDARYFASDGVVLGAVTKIVYDDNGNPIGRIKENPEGYHGLYNQAHYFEYSKLDSPVIDVNGVANGKTWRHYVEKAFSERWRQFSDFPNSATPEEYDSFWYRRSQGSGIGINPSSNTGAETGANVTFTDEATGLDFQLIYQPVPAWQIVFTYAHTEREPITPFQMVEALNQASGYQYGTEYDEWVRTFGRAAFGLEEHDDDGDGVVDRVTKIGENDVLQLGEVTTSDMVGGLEGISLYTGPEDTFSLFQKYSFLEGKLRGFEVNMGLTYTGPAQTSIPIGGDDLFENRFGTPPTPQAWLINAGLTYKWRWGEQFYDARLLVSNLFDDQKGENITQYSDYDGSTVLRRTTQYYTPRSFRLSLGIRF